MKFRNRFLWQFAGRVAAEGAIVAVKRDDLAEEERQGVALTIGVVAMCLALIYAFLFGLWLLTGRGPGMRLYLIEFAAPRQRPRRHSGKRQNGPVKPRRSRIA